LVDVAHRIYRILWRLVMVGRVVTFWNAVDVVQLAAVESPVTNEFLRELLVIGANFGHCRTQHSQAARHVRMLAVLVEDEPLRMLFCDFGYRIFVRFVFSFAIFYGERQPPYL